MPAAPHRRAPVPDPRRTPPRPTGRAGSRSAWALALAAGLAPCWAGGCSGLRSAWDRAVASDVPHPAVPDPPPRIAGATVAPDPHDPRPPALTLAAAGAPAPGEAVRTAGLDDPFAPAPTSTSPAAPAGPPRFADADVAALVNGEPLLAGDLLALDPEVGRLARAVAEAPTALEDPQRGLTPGQRDQLRTLLHAKRAQKLAQVLPVKIEEALLAQRMRRAMDKDQLEQLDDLVGTMFRETAMQEMIASVNAQAAKTGAPPVRTEQELERVMLAEGTSLQTVIDAWKPQQMAMAYVEQNAPTESIRVSRLEIADYYEEHLAEFTPPKAARWSQIEVPYAGPAEKPAAVEKLAAAAAKLEAGEPFAAVAAEYSDGPKSGDGGRWDWTVPDSLADEAADAALWDQPVGEIGAVVDCPRPAAGPGAGVLKLIRVDERRGDAAPPLAKLAGRIEERLKAEKRHRAISALLAEERAAAQVEVFVPGTVWPPAD